MFAVRYAQFHQLVLQEEYQDAAADLLAMFREELAPKSWWAVLLCDAVPLLQFGTTSIAIYASVTNSLSVTQDPFSYFHLQMPPNFSGNLTRYL
jgi:nuclear pore complex protein Nup85